MYTDPISDMLNRIKNATTVASPELSFQYSSLKNNILAILKNSGYISDYKVKSKLGKKYIFVQLENNTSQNKITGFKRLSTPGRRLYSGYKQIPKPRQGTGIVLVSTPAGIMTSVEATKKHQGGELIAEIS